MRKRNKDLLTNRQQQVLDFIVNEIRHKGYPPSVREICQAVGLSSSSTAHSHLNALERKGYIHRNPNKPRAIEVRGLREAEIVVSRNTRMVPVVGRIAAGSPVFAEENIEDYLTVPSEFTENGKIFILRVKGDSMIGAGICEGDYLLVKSQQTAENGDIVVALVGEEATVKRFFREEEYLILAPENPSMDPIITRDASVIGKAIALFRKI